MRYNFSLEMGRPIPIEYNLYVPRNLPCPMLQHARIVPGASPIRFVCVQVENSDINTHLVLPMLCMLGFKRDKSIG